jgi:hypothetical protein
MLLMSEVPHLRDRLRAEREELQTFSRFLPESQGHNLALIGLHVPHSPDSGTDFGFFLNVGFAFASAICVGAGHVAYQVLHYYLS